jgi:hypothetical protein
MFEALFNWFDCISASVLSFDQRLFYEYIPSKLRCFERKSTGAMAEQLRARLRCH